MAFSGGGAVLVDESAARGVSFDLVAWLDRDDIGGVVGCTLVDSAIRAVLVVVVDVLDEQGSELFRLCCVDAGRGDGLGG